MHETARKNFASISPNNFIYFSTLAAATTMQEHQEVVIAGGGIGGLILALCLDAQYNHSPSTSTATTITPETSENKLLEIHVYESASEFSPGAGGAIGLYANGLRVLRDLSNQHPLLTSLLDDVRTAVSTLKITIGKYNIYIVLLLYIILLYDDK